MNPEMIDPVIDEIRAVRHRISEKYDHDPAKLVAYLMEFQTQYQDRLVYVPVDPAPPTPTVAGNAEASNI